MRSLAEMDVKSLACVLNNSHSQWSEDKALLPLLLYATFGTGKPGTFVECVARPLASHTSELGHFANLAHTPPRVKVPAFGLNVNNGMTTTTIGDALMRNVRKNVLS